MTEAVQPDPHDALRAYMREQVKLTPSRKPSGYASVVAVLPEIRALKAKRRTDAEILAMFAEMGVKLSLATLRHYIQTALREAAGKKPVRRRGKTVAEPSAKAPPASAAHRASTGQTASSAAGPASEREHTRGSRAASGHRMTSQDL